MAYTPQYYVDRRQPPPARRPAARPAPAPEPEGVDPIRAEYAKMRRDALARAQRMGIQNSGKFADDEVRRMASIRGLPDPDQFQQRSDARTVARDFGRDDNIAPWVRMADPGLAMVANTAPAQRFINAFEAQSSSTMTSGLVRGKRVIDAYRDQGYFELSDITDSTDGQKGGYYNAVAALDQENTGVAASLGGMAGYIADPVWLGATGVGKLAVAGKFAKLKPWQANIAEDAASGLVGDVFATSIRTADPRDVATEAAYGVAGAVGLGLAGRGIGKAWRHFFPEEALPSSMDVAKRLLDERRPDWQRYVDGVDAADAAENRRIMSAELQARKADASAAEAGLDETLAANRAENVGIRQAAEKRAEEIIPSTLKDEDIYGADTGLQRFRRRQEAAEKLRNPRPSDVELPRPETQLDVDARVTTDVETVRAEALKDPDTFELVNDLEAMGMSRAEAEILAIPELGDIIRSNDARLPRQPENANRAANNVPAGRRDAGGALPDQEVSARQEVEPVQRGGSGDTLSGVGAADPKLVQASREELDGLRGKIRFYTEKLGSAPNQRAAKQVQAKLDEATAELEKAIAVGQKPTLDSAVSALDEYEAALENLRAYKGDDVGRLAKLEAQAEDAKRAFEAARPNLPSGSAKARGTTSILPDIVNAGLEAGKWTGKHTIAAAKWAMDTVGDGIRTMRDFAQSLIEQFGRAIRKHIPAAWERFKAMQGRRAQVRQRTARLRAKGGIDLRSRDDGFKIQDGETGLSLLKRLSETDTDEGRVAKLILGREEASKRLESVRVSDIGGGENYGNAYMDGSGVVKSMSFGGDWRSSHRTALHEIVHGAIGQHIESGMLTKGRSGDYLSGVRNLAKSDHPAAPVAKVYIDYLEKTGKTSNKSGLFGKVPDSIEHLKSSGLEYGDTSLHEFVAEAFSNPKFQEVLNSIDMGGKTLWGWFIESIKRALRIPIKDGSALHGALEESLSLMGKKAGSAAYPGAGYPYYQPPKLYQAGSKPAAEARNFQKDSLASRASQRLAGVKRTVDQLIDPIADRLYKTSPRIANRMYQYMTEANIAKHELRSVMDPIMGDQAIKKLAPYTRNELKSALLNADEAGLAKVLDGVSPEARAKVEEMVSEARRILDDLFNEAEAVGMEPGYLENFWPRSIKPGKTDLLREKLSGAQKSMFDDALKDLALRKYGGNVSAIPEVERASALARTLAGYGPRPLDSSLPKPLKQRSVTTIPDEYLQYYQDFDKSLDAYIERMTNEIAKRRMLGGGKSLDDEAMLAQSIAKMIDDEGIKGQKADEVASMIQSVIRGSEAPVGTGTRLLRDGGYILTMGQMSSAIRQLGDFATSANQYGVANTLKAAARTVAGENRVKLLDLGLDRMAEEYAGARSSKAVDFVFKVTGLDLLDRKLIKNTAIEAALLKAQKAARQNPEKLTKELTPEFGDDAAALVNDLATGEVSDRLMVYLTSRLGNIQPVTRLEVPQQYLDGRAMAGGGGLKGWPVLMYQLKTFTLRRMGLMRRQGLHEMAKGLTMIKRGEQGGTERFLKGARNLVTMAAMFAGADTAVDQLIAWVFGDDDSLSDSAWDAMWQLIGMNRYGVEQAKRSGATGASAIFMPPSVTTLMQVVTDLTRLADGKDSKTIQRLPHAKTIKRFLEVGGSSPGMDSPDMPDMPDLPDLPGLPDLP